MREHIMQDARIHYVITNGGGQPNVVPPEAEVWYYIRANEFDDVVIYFDWIKEIAEGAAKMSRTTLEAIEVQSEAHQLLPTRAMSELMHENFTAVGPAAWTAQELTFTRRTQEAFGRTSGVPYAGDVVLHTEIEPLPGEIQQGPASTDVADISWFVPVGNLRVASFGYGIPTHTWPVVASTGTSIGTKALIIAGKTLAASAIDLYTDSALLETVKLDWREIRGDRPWKTLIPEGQAAPETLR